MTGPACRYSARGGMSYVTDCFSAARSSTECAVKPCNGTKASGHADGWPRCTYDTADFAMECREVGITPALRPKHCWPPLGHRRARYAARDDGAICAEFTCQGFDGDESGFGAERA